MSSQYHLKVRKSSIIVIREALEKMDPSEDVDRTKQKVERLYEKAMAHEQKKEAEKEQK